MASVIDRNEFGTDRTFTMKQLIEAGKSIFDGEHKVISAPAFLKDGGGDLFSQMFKENYQHFVDMEKKTANFVDGEFEALISTVKELAENGYISTGISQSENLEELMVSGMGDVTTRYLFKTKNNFSLVQETYPGSELNMMVSTSGAAAGIEADDEIAGIGVDEAGITPFAYGQAYGINSNSQNKETAWAFLKFLLSYDIQVSPSLSLISLPLHNEARQDKAEALYSMLLANGGELDEIQTQALNSYIEVVEVMSDRSRQPSYHHQ